MGVNLAGKPCVSCGRPWEQRARAVPEAWGAGGISRAAAGWRRRGYQMPGFSSLSLE